MQRLHAPIPVLSIMFVLCISTATASAQTTEEYKARINTGRVSLITGGIEYASNTYGQLAGDVAAVLDKPGKMRILPVMGYGAVRNVEDMLYLRGIDVGMLHSDVLKHLELEGKLPAARRRLRLFTKLYDEVFHCIAPRSVSTLASLDGKPLAIGPKQSAADMSARTLLRLLKLKPNLVNVPWTLAETLLKSGTIAGLVYPTRAPSKYVRKLLANPDWHLCSMQPTAATDDTYTAIRLTSKDYPEVLKGDETIDTLRFAAILAVFNWSPNGARYDIVKKFAESFYSNFDELKKPGRHAIWQSLDLKEEVKGWERYEPVRRLLARLPKTTKPSLEKVIARALSGSKNASEEFERFAKFVLNRLGNKSATNDELFELYVNFKIRQRTEEAEKKATKRSSSTQR